MYQVAAQHMAQLPRLNAKNRAARGAKTTHTITRQETHPGELSTRYFKLFTHKKQVKTAHEGAEAADRRTRNNVASHTQTLRQRRPVRHRPEWPHLETEVKFGDLKKAT